MISKEQKETVIDEFGKHYASKIIPKLTAAGILNTKNEPFEAPAFRAIVNGRVENIEVEKFLLRLIVQQKKLREKLSDDWQKIQK